jgi:methyl-accepting chemotaxis protein
MAHDTLLTVFVIIAALALAGQAAAMLGLYLSLRDVPRQIEDIRRNVSERFGPLADSVKEIVSTSREPVRTITSNLAEISQVLRERASSVDLVVADVLEKSRAQVIRVDRLITDLTQKVETTANAVERGVMGPAQEVSAVVAGVRTGLEFLFSGKGRKSKADQVTHDEELFI